MKLEVVFKLIYFLTGGNVLIAIGSFSLVYNRISVNKVFLF